jgi:thymidylate kinase
VHYHLAQKRERFYFRLLRRILPKPDLALMFVASPENIIERRRHYDPDYLQRLSERYAEVIREFPNITVIRTDEFDGLDATVAAHLKKAIAANGRWRGQRLQVPFSNTM